MAKVFEVAFRISGAMSGQFAAAMRAAQNSMRALSSSASATNAAMQQGATALHRYLANLNQISQNASKFAQLKREVVSNQTAMQQANQNTAALAREYRTQQQAAQALKAKLDELKAAYQSQKGALPRAELQSLKAQIKSLTQEWKSAEQGVKSASREFETAKNKARALKETLQAQLSQLQSLRASLSAAGFSTSSFAASEQRLRSEIEATTRAIERQAQVQQRLSAARAQSQSATQNLGMSAAGVMGAVYSAQSMAAPFTAAIDNAVTFEHAMSRVKALTQSENIRNGNFAQVQADMAKLEAQARELGATTQFTMTQAAEAMGYLGMAGWKTEQIYGTMPGMLNLAAGAGTDLARTADIVSDNMTAMGVPVEKAAHFMDVYAYALTNSNVNLESLGETMKYAAPVAAAFGATLEDTAAMTMMMGNAGIKGSMAGTALRMGLLRLSGPPKKASKAMDELGISVSDATAMAMEAEAELARLGVQYDKNAPPMEKMGNIIRQLSDKMQGLSQEEKLASIGAIFGANAASGWVNIIEQGPEVFEKYLAALKNCDGYSEQFAHTMNDDTRGALIALESAIDAVQNSIGTAFLPSVRAAAEAITPLATAFSLWIQQHPQVVQGIGAIVAALSALMIFAASVKLIFAGWSFIVAQIELVQASMAALAAGTTPIAARFMALRGTILSTVASMRALTWGSIGASISAGFNGIIASATEARVAIMSFFASLSVSSIAATVTTALKGVGTAIAGVARAAMAFVFSPIGVALMALALAAVYVYQNWDRLAPVFSNLANVITGTLGTALQTITPAISALRTAFNGLMATLSSSGALSTLSSIFGTLANLIGGILVKAFIVLANVAVGALSAVVNIFATIVSTVATVVSEIINLITNVLTGQWQAAWQNLKNIVVTVFEGIADIILAPFKAIGETIGNITKSFEIFNASKDVASGAAVRRHAITPQVTTSTSTTQETNVKVDTTQAQNQINQLGDAAQQSAVTVQNNATVNETVTQQAAQVVQTTSEATQQVQQVVQTTTAATEQIQQSAQTTTESNLQVQQSITEMSQTLQESLSSTQESVSSVSTSFEETSTATSNFNQEIQNSVTNITANSQSFQQNTTNITANSTAIQANTAQLQASTAGLSAFNAALASTNGGLSALATNSSSAASSIQALGSAAQSAVSAMQNAASSVASAAASASAAAAKPAQNYAGGIYPQGAFLTWFAEKSPEAAIPLDKSPRAIELWQQAGQMLGVLPGSPVNVDSPQIGTTANDYRSYQQQQQQRAQTVYNLAKNYSTAYSADNRNYFDSKKYSNFSKSNVENRIFYANSANKFAKINNVSNSASASNLKYNTHLPQFILSSASIPQYDELGNIKNLRGLSENIITREDDKLVTRSKQQAQLREFNATNKVTEITAQFEKIASVSNKVDTAALTKTTETLKVFSEASSNANSAEKILQQQTEATVANQTTSEVIAERIRTMERAGTFEKQQGNGRISEGNAERFWNVFFTGGNQRVNQSSVLQRAIENVILNQNATGGTISENLAQRIYQRQGNYNYNTTSYNYATNFSTEMYQKSSPLTIISKMLRVASSMSKVQSSLTERSLAIDSDSVFDNSLSNLSTNSSMNQSIEMPPITVNLSITINGNADAKEVERGARAVIPEMREAFGSQIETYFHEVQRRSYR